MPDVLAKRDGAILEITLNRPDHGNGATDEMAVEVTRLIREAADTAQCIVLRGAGADFCVGRAMMGQPPAQGPVEAYERKRAFDVIFNTYGAIRGSPIPVIGVVQGRAHGFGCAVAAVCDITLASDKATFQVPEMGHNILPTMVMSSFIDRVPRKAFTYLVYSTKIISAERAVSFGIASDVVPAAQLEETVKTVTGAILKAPPPAIRGVKEYARTAYNMSTEGAIDFARNIHAVINSSSEMRRKG
ncbi:MAG TPA: enoyl-CoA hydratase/isomerase family protein [Stellaceae bacterium]|nr:enoyl-CoA hydratase/isomerase family protein [Stellaceae bacterium]